MSVKKRKYSEDYLQYGFTDAMVNDQVVPQCVICFQILSNDALRPTRLQRHLQTKHSCHHNKPLVFFQSKKDLFKKINIASKETFCQSILAEVVEASFVITRMIAQAKKPRNIGETLIKPCMIKAASLILGVASSNKLAKISLSDSTIKTPVVELANDIEFQVLKKLKASPYFAIQCDEITDVAKLSQLLVYVRYVESTCVEEEVLFCRPLETTDKAEDVYHFVTSFFDDKGLQWEKLVGICTDGALTMLGFQSGFIARIKQKSSNAVETHCIIHREALASKTLTAAMKDKLATAIRVVNFIKASASNTRLLNHLCKEMDSAYETLFFQTSVRWLSKGNMLARVYDMREEVKRFLESHGKQDLLLSFTSEEFQLTLAYLVDIFGSLNHLNLLLQGKNTNRVNNYDAIRAFIVKLGLWQRRVQKGNAASFPNFDTALEEKSINLEGHLKSEIKSHLQQLKQEFECYFSDLNDTDFRFGR